MKPRSECNCHCHTNPNVKHVMACCRGFGFPKEDWTPLTRLSRNIYLQISNSHSIIGVTYYAPTRSECDEKYAKFLGKPNAPGISRFNCWVEEWEIGGNKIKDAVDIIENTPILSEIDASLKTE